MKPLIVFDLDGTLFDAELSYEAALNALGLSAAHPEFQAARARVKARLGAKHPSARNRLLYFKTMLEARNGGSAPEALELMAHYEKALAEQVRAQFADGARLSFLKGLAKMASLAILTNENTRTQLIKLNAIDPKGEAISLMLTSEEAGFEKPDKRGFEMIRAHFSAAPADCTMVGDSVIDDIEPARALGWRTVLSTEFHPRHMRGMEPPDGTSVIATLTDLKTEVIS